MQGIEDAADRLVQAPAQEKLRRIAQLCIALSLYIGDIVSTMQIGVVLTLLIAREDHCKHCKFGDHASIGLHH